MDNCPICGAKLVDMTVHGGPVNVVCANGHRNPEPPANEPEPQPQGILARVIEAARNMISR